jgi:Leucine-rich repeat (LRR) protein
LDDDHSPGWGGGGGVCYHRSRVDPADWTKLQLAGLGAYEQYLPGIFSFSNRTQTSALITLAMIEFEDGRYGLRAVIGSPWNDQIAEAVKSKACVELELNHAKGWKGEDLSFLAAMPELRAISILDFKIKSVVPVHHLHELRSLEIITYCNTPISFSSFPHLESCSLEWRRGSDSLFACRGLRDLFLNKCVCSDLMKFKSLSKLESLAMLNSPLVSLSGIEDLRELRSLRLGNLRKLKSIHGIESLIKLEELDLDTCRLISSVAEVAGLAKLKKLFLNNLGDIDSLPPLEAFSELEMLTFYNSTNIKDGNLKPILGCKKLKTIAFQNRKHYNMTREEFGLGW